MTRGVGGSTIEAELARLRARRDEVPAIGDDERADRIARLQAAMRAEGVQALYLDASTSTFYFTGVRLHGSERLHGVVVPAAGEIAYITPAFEAEKLETMIRLPGRICRWHEHEDPAALVLDTKAQAPLDPFLERRMGAEQLTDATGNAHRGHALG